MSNVSKAVAILVTTFNKYAGREGDPHTLSKAELKELLQNEFGDLLNVKKMEVDKIFKNLDDNGDNSVDFTEYGMFILSLTMICHEYFKAKDKRAP